MLAGQITRLRTGLLLPQHRNDLLFREPLPLNLSVLQSRPNSNSRWRKNSVARQYLQAKLVTRAMTARAKAGADSSGPNYSEFAIADDRPKTMTRFNGFRIPWLSIRVSAVERNPLASRYRLSCVGTPVRSSISSLALLRECCDEPNLNSIAMTRRKPSPPEK